MDALNKKELESLEIVLSLKYLVPIRITQKLKDEYLILQDSFGNQKKINCRWNSKSATITDVFKICSDNHRYFFEVANE